MEAEQQGLDVARALRAPLVPAVFATLAEAGYLERVWPQLAPSVDTAGFLGSALYMADMALDAVIDTYEPLLTAGSLRKGGLQEGALAGLTAVLDVFQYTQPQMLLVCAALAEAWGRPSVGGQGRLEPRVTSDREQRHLATQVRLAPPDLPPLPDVATALQAGEAPELYRAVALWPEYLGAVWGELQHLAAYPQLRRRARALYYYARSASRFLAQPIDASRETLLASGLSPEALDDGHRAIEAALPLTATMIVHCCAMRVGLGITAPELPPRP